MRVWHNFQEGVLKVTVGEAGNEDTRKSHLLHPPPLPTCRFRVGGQVGADAGPLEERGLAGKAGTGAAPGGQRQNHREDSRFGVEHGDLPKVASFKNGMEEVRQIQVRQFFFDLGLTR